MSRTNPCTSPDHDANGRLKAGNTIARMKSKNRLTRELFNYMFEGSYTKEAGEYLVSIMKDDKAPIKERRAATEFIIKHFTVSADKITDAELIEQSGISKAEMIKGLLGGNTTEE